MTACNVPASAVPLLGTWTAAIAWSYPRSAFSRFRVLDPQPPPRFRVFAFWTLLPCGSFAFSRFRVLDPCCPVDPSAFCDHRLMCFIFQDKPQRKTLKPDASRWEMVCGQSADSLTTLKRRSPDLCTSFIVCMKEASTFDGQLSPVSPWCVQAGCQVLCEEMVCGQSADSLTTL